MLGSCVDVAHWCASFLNGDVQVVSASRAPVSVAFATCGPSQLLSYGSQGKKNVNENKMSVWLLSCFVQVYLAHCLCKSA